MNKKVIGIIIAVAVVALVVVLGIVFLAATEELIKTFNYVLVSICAIIGIIQLIQFFINKKYKDTDYITGEDINL